MEFKGHPAVEELSKLLQNESTRCLVIVSAAFFDETLGYLLGDKVDRALSNRINDAIQYGLLTSDEYDDLHSLRGLRNAFAHDLRMDSFDADATAAIEGMRIWRAASNTLPQYRSLLPSTRDRLLYVVAVIAFRLQHRTRSSHKCGPLTEPEVTNVSAFPPLMSP